MAVCGSCGADNPGGFKFCGSCGTELGGPGCPSCGFANPAGQQFCGQCGTRLSEESAPAAARATSSPGERKLATILFADVVGFTSMSENADPEAVARTVDAAFRRMAEVVESHGGTVDKYLGDALMAVFGVPVAHDDDAERAIAAALAMRELGGDLAFSIGINSGEVMATAVGRDGDVTVIGDAVNVAARLEKAAGGGEVLVGPLTADLAGDAVVFRERQPVILKGKRDPVPVCEVIGLRQGEAASIERERPPLIGRDDELAFLRAQWRRVVRDERAGVVLVAGEPGMGKTRLLEELTSDIAAEAAVAHTRYPAYGGLGGPQIAAEIAEQLGAMGEHDVDVRVKSVAGEVDESLRELDPEAFRQEQLWAYRRYLEAKAAEQPILIVIDDIHRSGDQTLELLSELMARVGDVPILLALAGRPEPGEWLARFPGATTVRLSPLSSDDSVALVESLLPGGAEPDDAVRAAVARGTGNPLYLRELVAVVCSDTGVAPASLPPTLQAILAARLDALRPEEKGAIQRVSVLGDVATEEQVATLGLTDTSALRNLVASGLLRLRKDECYEVVDPLLREVAYETLPRQVRGEWHRRAADAVRDPVQRARQLERAVDYLPDDEALSAETAAALRDVGVKLVDGYRLNDGISLLLRAVQHGEREPAVLLRLASALTNNGRGEEGATVLSHLDDAELSPSQLAERGHIKAVSHMFRDPQTSLVPLQEAAQRWADLGEPVKEGWAWSNRGVALFNSGQMAEASENLERAIALFAAHGEYNGKLAAQSFLALIRPDDPRVSDWLEEALRRAEDLGDRSGQANALILLSWHHTFRAHLGGREQVAVAEDYADRGRDLAADLGFHEFHAHGLCLGAMSRRFRGELDEARDLAERAQQVPLESGSPVHELVKAARFLAAAAHDPAATEPALSTSNDPVVWVGWLLVVEALLLAGRLDDAQRVMETIEGLPGLGGAIDGMTRNMTVGYGLLMLDRADEALPLLRDCLVSARAVRSESMTQVAHALLGEALSRTREAEDAALHLEKTADAADDGVVGALVLRARVVSGDDSAADELRRAAETLGAPGLVIGAASA